jgi:hypothetical protein
VLTQYQTRTNQLLIYPVPPTPLYQTSDITGWVNQARGQLAGESECVRVLGTISLASSTIAYPFTAINLGGTSGVAGIINVRQMWYDVASGKQRVTSRPWEWFSVYNLNNPVPAPGPPMTWAQFGQGSSAQSSPNPVGGGSVYIDPPPDQSYTAYVDCVCFPSALASDSDPEAIPYLWTDAVPYFSAYLALLSAQSGARMAQAEKMLQLYEQFANRARQYVTPSILPGDYEQQPVIQTPNLLGQAAQTRAGR